MERDGELSSIVCHALMNGSDLIISLEVGAMSVFWSAIILRGGSAEFLQASRVLFFEGGAFLEEACKFLHTSIRLYFK